jgi:hypothetical protein
MARSNEPLLNRILRQGENTGLVGFYAVAAVAAMLLIQFLRT